MPKDLQTSFLLGELEDIHARLDALERLDGFSDMVKGAVKKVSNYAANAKKYIGMGKLNMHNMVFVIHSEFLDGRNHIEVDKGSSPKHPGGFVTFHYNNTIYEVYAKDANTFTICKGDAECKDCTDYESLLRGIRELAGEYVKASAEDISRYSQAVIRAQCSAGPRGSLLGVA
jgi:hypothetical protein